MFTGFSENKLIQLTRDRNINSFIKLLSCADSANKKLNHAICAVNLMILLAEENII